jgi:hypothetical protein
VFFFTVCVAFQPHPHIGNVFSNHSERNNVEESVLDMATYVQDQVAHLNKNVSDDQVLQGEVHWIPAPGCGGVAESARGTDSAEQPASYVDEQQDEWREATSDDGNVYYWNPRTRESRWK